MSRSQLWRHKIEPYGPRSVNKWTLSSLHTHAHTRQSCKFQKCWWSIVLHHTIRALYLSFNVSVDTIEEISGLSTIWANSRRNGIHSVKFGFVCGGKKSDPCKHDICMNMTSKTDYINNDGDDDADYCKVFVKVKHDHCRPCECSLTRSKEPFLEMSRVILMFVLFIYVAPSRVTETKQWNIEYVGESHVYCYNGQFFSKR